MLLDKGKDEGANESAVHGGILEICDKAGAIRFKNCCRAF